MDPELSDHLREVYLFTYDAYATNPSDVADGLEINIRYSRELLGILAHNNLIHVVPEDGEDTWRCKVTYDTEDRNAAVNRIDAFLNRHGNQKEGKMPTATQTQPKAPAKKAAAPTEFKHCLCGCGENVPPKSNFRPGHDARMAGRIGKAFIAAGEIDDELLQTLPTEALRDKAAAMFTKHTEKRKAATAAKVAKAAETVPAKPEPEPEPKPEPKPKPTPTSRKRAAKKA